MIRHYRWPSLLSGISVIRRARFYDHLPMESLPVRTREVFDYAQPSGNALFAQSAFTLYLYSGEQRWLDLHHQLTSAMQTGMERFRRLAGSGFRLLSLCNIR